MKYHCENWKHASPDQPGFHKVIGSENSECRVLQIFRLNLAAGQTVTVNQPLELAGAVIRGTGKISVDDKVFSFGRFDGIYLPGGTSARFTAESDSVFYFGGAPFEGKGEVFFRRYDPTLPVGEIHQIHGEKPYRRDVFMTLDHHTAASRLIAGLTWSDEGAWTSWPPHQHELDLEEVYCYFDLDKPGFGMHLSYLSPGDLPTVHPVRSGDMVEAPAGYHPTVAAPGMRNAYFWVLGALRGSSRRYDLAKTDPNYAKER
ncbi:MAG: 5-deoxy-glucuronate isomerase [Victivallaceae bacterium]|nr:5-deoxy-glucuronate isomerase [Victivallaceae bacterium]